MRRRVRGCKGHRGLGEKEERDTRVEADVLC